MSKKLTRRQLHVLIMQYMAAPMENSLIALYQEDIISLKEATHLLVDCSAIRDEIRALDSERLPYAEAVFDLICLLLLEAGEEI